MRVDIDRLDSLMNLAGELVVNRARFVQVAGQVEIDEPPLHRNLKVQLFGRSFVEVMFPAEIEHLQNGLFMNKTGNIMKRSAMVRIKIGRIGIQKI